MAQGNQVQKRNLAAEAFGRHYDTLHSALAQPDVASGLATKFYNGAIITSEIRDVVQMTSFTPKQQADWLLPVVESSIRTDHRKLRRLIKVLRKQPVLKPIAKQLHQCYRDLVSEARLTVSSSSGSDTDSTEPEHQSHGPTTGGERLQSPYGEGGASKGSRPPAVGKGKRRKESSSNPKAKKIKLRAGSEDEFDSSLKDETHRPGFIPPPINRDEAQSEQGTQVKDEAFPELLNILYPVASKWELFVQQIGVPHVQITHIKAANPLADPSICLSHALKWWQSNHDSPVYEIIIDVLDPGIGEVTPAMNKAVAKKVREFMAKQQGPMIRGERSPSPYQEGGASKGNRPPAIGKGKRRKQSSSGPKAKKPRPSDRGRTGSAGSELEFEGSLEAGTHGPSSVTPPINKKQAKQVKAEEQGCGEVSLSSETVHLFPKSIPSGIGGSDHEKVASQGHSDTSSSFPYLHFHKLTEEEETALRCKLLKDSDEIVDEFSQLTDNTIKSIISRDISVKKLHTRLSDLGAYTPIRKQVPLLRNQMDEIERAEDVEGVFSILHKYYSFFNYRIIKMLIVWFGTPEDKERLQTYIEHFKMFCKRRTFECPPDIFGRVDKTKTNLVVKVEESWDPREECTLETTIRLRNFIGDILGVEPWTLYLCRIDDGCMELLFQVPFFVEKDIFPLSMQQERSLSSVGVIKLTCGSYSFSHPPEALVPQTPAQAEAQVKPKRTFKEISSDSTSGTRVQKSALPKLLVILSPVVHNWSSFAGLIGVPSSQISVIEAANPRHRVKCLSQSLDWWITNHCNPTYEAILAILDPKWGETTPLMNRDLAKEVKEFMTKEQGLFEEEPSVSTSGPFTVDDTTRQNMVEIQRKFAKLLQMVYDYLQEKMKKSQIKNFRLFILDLFPNISPEVIPNSSDLNEIFEAMRCNRLWSYMNYFSLEQTIKNFCSDNPDMIGEIEKFKKDRAEFQCATKIGAYIPAAKAYLHEHEQLNPVNLEVFSKLSLTLEECVADYSLKYLEELWQSLSFHMQLPPIQLLFDVIDRGSIQIVFLIPTKLVPQVIHQAHYSAYFYEMHHKHVRSVTVNNTCIYDRPVAIVTKQDVPEEEPSRGGFTCTFVQPPPEGLQTQCSVCLQVLREPHIVDCCGNRFCLSCINHIKADGKSCPLCNRTTFELMPDKQLDRSLKDLKVHCTHAEKGCGWTGELRKLDKHFNENPNPDALLEGCAFIKIKCTHCGFLCQRDEFTSHQTECQKLRAHRAKKLFDKAMKSGFVESLAIKVIVTGAAGSGKSCAKEVILSRKPPKKRVSTKLAQRPVRLDRAQTLESNWKTVTQDRIQAMVADVIKSLELNKSQAEAESITTLGDSSHETNQASTNATHPLSEAEALSTMTETSSYKSSQVSTEAAFLLSKKEKQSSQEPKFSHQSPTAAKKEPKSSHQSSTAAKEEGAPIKMKTVPLPSDTEEELLKLLQQAPSSVPVLRFEWVYFIDSGGQPQFHEILPVFLKGASICIFVHKLSETLDEYPVVEFYDDNGQLVGKSCVSAHSNIQVFQHCLRMMQSHSSQAANRKPPKILILGTHADLEDTCSETRLDKNRRLLEILLPTVPNQIIYNGQDKKQVIFPMNAQDPGEAEYRIAEQIRELIMKEGSPEVHKIPLSWYVLEQALRELAQKLGRGVLCKEECFTIASSLHFTEETFLAALQYLDDLNILFYYPDILPEVVFTDPQIVLDKASELVKFSYQLQEEPKEGVVFKAEWRKFQDYGLVTAEFLGEFNDHYVEGIFTPKELIKLFKALLVLADFSATEFFMPALLRILNSEEIEKHRVPRLSVVDPLFIYFPHGPQNGMFCSLITFLVSRENRSPIAWELHLATGSPTCLYRNCARFIIPSFPGSITLIDSFTHFEVHINTPTTKICKYVRNAIFEGLERVASVLHYIDSRPQLAFQCPCKEGSTHAATIGADETFWICSQNVEKWGQLQDKQRVWLQSAGPDQMITKPPLLHSTIDSSTSTSTRATEDILDDSDLYDIKCYLKDLNMFDVYNLGLVLGLDLQRVKVIKDSDTFLDDVLAAWLRREDNVEKRDTPSWRTLVKGLNHPSLGQSAVASDICRDKKNLR